jgi:uridine kinase
MSADSGLSGLGYLTLAQICDVATQRVGCGGGFGGEGGRIRQYPPGTPESYYFEMLNVDAIRENLLGPLGPGGDRRYRTQIMDFSGRTSIDSGVQVSPDDAILVADGGFLQKPALASQWDLVVYLHIEVADVLRRGPIRDQAWMDRAEAAAERYRSYYIPGEQLYLTEIGPAERADIVIQQPGLRCAPDPALPSRPRS